MASVKRIAAGRCFWGNLKRRFGKSLFLSTLEAYFLGQKELFKGLYLEKLEEEKEYYEEKINEISAELKQIENNKKAWLEFLQIEDNQRPLQ